MSDAEKTPNLDLQRCHALVDEIDERVAELRREIVAATSGQDLSLAGAAAVISAFCDERVAEPDTVTAARAWLRAWESLP